MYTDDSHFSKFSSAEECFTGPAGWLHCQLFNSERQSNNRSDPRGCEMPLKTCREPVFMASVIGFILHNLGRVYMQNHIWSWLCLYHLPFAPPVDSYNWSDESQIPLLLNSSKQDITSASMVKGRVERGRSGAGEETYIEKTESVLSPNAKLPYRSRRLCERDMSDSKQCPHC